MMTCQAVAATASAYLDRELPLSRRAAVAWHLRLCPNCRAYLATLKRTIGLARKAPVAAPAPEVEDNLAALFRARQNSAD
ncbi:anti-sigma factor [Roseomonas terrae]|jgi:anti-sigma factor RsiW|uniref:Anti-sigma factor n=1 Tax=Neoroseomonas terrae TaxID=424799 RepID=A0ABS5EEG8_9PROT|nr:zf-HC2 domain-containing protein [Neoroseomonas terrae]MBR0649409.1 anti-sigma factor [Neoroseomonas terrae]